MKNTLLLLSLFSLSVPLSTHCSFSMRKCKKDVAVKHATESLIWAAKEGDPKKALAALHAGANVNGNYYKDTGSIGRGTIGRRLLGNEFSPIDDLGTIPLVEACRMCAELYEDTDKYRELSKNYLTTIALLLRHRALITAVDDQGRTAVSFSCKNGQAEILALLLKHGAPYEEENQTIVTDRMVSKRHLYLPGPRTIHLITPAVDLHIARQKHLREEDPAIASLLETQKTSFQLIPENPPFN